jgi:hypothetical protein
MQLVDPGNAGTIGGVLGIDRSPAVCALTSAGAETRTLPAPTADGDIITITGKVVAGTITVTVTGGYNANGDTTFTISAANQFYQFIAVNSLWRLADAYFLSNSTIALPTPSTPAAVATSPGTAQTAELTATGGVGGNSTIATTGVGGVGGGYSLVSGAGGVATAAVTAATGGAGGAFTITQGAGGAESVATVTSTGGAGGAFAETTGAGGAVSGAVSGTGTGGASGTLTVATGAGGAITATTGTNVGGASGAVSILSGPGGAASGGSGNTGGASGSFTIGSGSGGNGTQTGGVSGDTIVQTGAVGTGGSPLAGNIIFKPAVTERFRITGTGVLTSLGAAPTNVTAAGSIICTAFTTTDVTNASFTQASHGAGTVAYFIGNASINVTSDVRVKKDVVAWKGDALDALAHAPRLVEYTYDLPTDGNEDFGPNSRGRYIGFIAQETIDAFPWVVNAGGGKNCPKCRAGMKCDNPDHGNWTVEYEHLVPLMMGALQQLVARVKHLESQLRP